MKISIITPSFNSGNFIEENIISVKNQDYQNIEHLIQDNLSNDKTHSVLNKYKHLKVFIESDGGQSDALNKLLKNTEGDIIGWLNADDYYSKNIFKEIINIFNNNPNLDAIYGNYNLVNAQNKLLRCIKSLKFYPSFLPYLCFIPSTTFFCRSSLIKENNIQFRKELYYMMDKDFFCQLINKSKNFKKINSTLSNFRVHEISKTAFNLNNVKKNKFYFEGIDILNRYTMFKLKKNILGIILFKLIINFFRLGSFFIKRIND